MVALVSSIASLLNLAWNHSRRQDHVRQAASDGRVRKEVRGDRWRERSPVEFPHEPWTDHLQRLGHRWSGEIRL